jgi:hypothetical protein
MFELKRISKMEKSYIKECSNLKKVQIRMFKFEKSSNLKSTKLKKV